jgi:hypothetical protein
MTTIVTFQRELTRLIDSIESAPSNNVTEQQIANALYIASILEGAAKPYAKAKDKVKQSYSDKLAEPTPKFDLIETPDIIVSVKVDNGRNSFDKDAFITMLVAKYNIPGREIYELADVCVKTSANVVTITAEARR